MWDRSPVIRYGLESKLETQPSFSRAPTCKTLNPDYICGDIWFGAYVFGDTNNSLAVLLPYKPNGVPSQDIRIYERGTIAQEDIAQTLHMLTLDIYSAAQELLHANIRRVAKEFPQIKFELK